MHNFWYHSPVRFYTNADDLVDITNPQNVYNNSQPYALELEVYHRYLIPNYNNIVLDFDLKLILVTQHSEIEIPCLFGFIDSKLQKITFKYNDYASGYFEIRNSENTTLFTSNCIKFIDSSDYYGRKFVRLVTKHIYDRFLFNFSDYVVTNLPAYNIGKFKIETDASNSRTGGNSTLRPKEAYHDEVTPYEFVANGDSNILGFLQTHVTNNEFYIDGTLRTSLNKLETDDFSAFGKIDFVSVKDKFGQNITIDEDVIFDDLNLKVVELTPIDNYINEASIYNGEIKIKFNNKVLPTADLTKKIKVYKDSVLLFEKNNSEVSIDYYTVTINTDVLEAGDYHILIDGGMFKNNIGNEFEGISDDTTWNFTLTSVAIETSISIEWEDGTNTDISGVLSNINIKVDTLVENPNNPILSYVFEKGSDGITYETFASGTSLILLASPTNVLLNISDNYFRLKLILQDNTEILSNTLHYTKENLITTDFFYKAKHSYSHPGNDYVIYIDSEGNQQTKILERAHFDSEMNWIEAPCMLIEANQIIETVGAIVCTI